MRARKPRFVIQKHAARRLHYDFRLEGEGVFKSWAVPKGPSTDPRVKRLAVEVEDHALSWGDFEGVLAAGQYGAGAVLVWDAGTYENLTEAGGEIIPMERALANGHAGFRLEGEKLHGGYTLTRFGRPTARNWLLVKMPDEAADAKDDLLSTRPESVLSGRTIEQVAEASGG